MALLSFTDIIIAATLIVNALALASSKIQRVNIGGDGRSNTSVLKPVDESIDADVTDVSPLTRLQDLSMKFRKFSCVIALWNVFFFFLMISVFPG